MKGKPRLKSLKSRIMTSTVVTVAVSIFIISAAIFAALFNSLRETAKSDSLIWGQKYAVIFESKINAAINYLSIAASTLESQVENNASDRTELQKTFYNIFDDYTLIDGTSIMFEYNMYDGKDGEYVNSEYGTIASGRICWYFYWENGKAVYLPQADVSDTTDSEFAGAYYTDAKTFGKPIYTEPFVYEVDGKDIPMFTLSYPMKDSKGTFLGVVTVDLFLDDLYAQLQSEQIYKTGYIVVTNDKDQVIYSPIYEDVSKSRREAKADYVLPDAGGTVAYSYAKSLINRRSSLVTSVSVHIPQLDSDFYISVVAPTVEIYSGGIILVVILVMFSMIFIVAIGFILYSNINKSTAPLIVLADISNKIADGDFNFTLPETNNDEIGILAKNFASMSLVIHNLTADINSLLVEHKNRNVSFSLDIAKYKGVYAEVVARISEMALSFNRILSEINRVAHEVAEEARKIASDANDTNRLTDISKEAAFNGNENMRAMIDAMEAIKVSSLNVGGVTQVIEEISRQTNILALNASVEAARAGTQGVSFAVVAEEVRHLASKIQNSINETRILIEDTINKVASGSSIALLTDESLKEIIKSITQISGLIVNITRASDEQLNFTKSLEKLSDHM